MIDMNRYFLHGKLSAHPGKGSELSAILLQASNLLKSAKGCQLYAISKDESTPDDIWITEFWDSEEDHDNSLKSNDIRSLISTAIPLLAGNPQKGQVLCVLGGLGVE